MKMTLTDFPLLMTNYGVFSKSVPPILNHLNH